MLGQRWERKTCSSVTKDKSFNFIRGSIRPTPSGRRRSYLVWVVCESPTLFLRICLKCTSYKEFKSLKQTDCLTICLICSLRVSGTNVLCRWSLCVCVCAGVQVGAFYVHLSLQSMLSYCSYHHVCMICPHKCSNIICEYTKFDTFPLLRA